MDRTGISGSGTAPATRRARSAERADRGWDWPGRDEGATSVGRPPTAGEPAEPASMVRVVRYAAFYNEATGGWLGAWTPWQTTSILPNGAAIELPASTVARLAVV